MLCVAQRAEHAPVFGAEGALSRQGGRQRIRCAREGGVDAIPNHLENDPRIGGDRVAYQRIMAGKGGGHCLRVLLPQLRTAFDIGEEKGHRPDR